MPHYLIGTDANKCGSVEINDRGGLTQTTMYPVAPTTVDPDQLDDDEEEEESPSKSPQATTTTTTQWLVQHPTLPLVVVLTSYWNGQPSHLSCFQQSEDGTQLTKLPAQATTAGKDAVYGVFSPHKQDADTVTLAVAHHNSSFVSFFSFSTTELPGSNFPEQPTVTMALPELVQGTRKLSKLGQGHGQSRPSSHHILYDRWGKYLWIVDPNQSAIFTYTVDPQTGLPVFPKSPPNSKSKQKHQKPTPSSIFPCHTQAPTLTWFGSLVGNWKGHQPKRLALSPNGEFVYVLYETRNVVQVYGVNPKTGEIDTACLQEVSTLDPKFANSFVVGLTVQESSEMMVSQNALYVSNKSSAFAGAGRVENSIKVFAIRDGGRLAIEPKTVPCGGPVTHFAVFPKEGQEILVAGTGEPVQTMQTFARDKDRSLRADKPNDYKLVGDAHVEVNVLCILPAGNKEIKADDGVIPTLPVRTRNSATRSSIVMQLKAKHAADDRKQEDLTDAISQLEDLYSMSFNHREEDAVMVEAPPKKTVDV